MTPSEPNIHIVFRGVRGSHPMPGPTTLRFGGNTSCQEVRIGGRLIVLDAGTGIISLGVDLAGKPQNMAIFFSHNHHDHIGGILYFRPAYSPKTTLHIFGPADNPGTILDALEDISSPAAHPVQLARMGMNYSCTVLDGGEVVVWAKDAGAPHLARPDEAIPPDAVVVWVFKNPLHPIVGVLNFRLEYNGKSYVYASDVEGDEENGDPALAEFAKGADLLAHDGQYTSDEYSAFHKGWGHSTVKMAVKTAKLAGITRLAIIHHEPMHSDAKLEEMEREAQGLFPGLFFAREGESAEV